MSEYKVDKSLPAAERVARAAAYVFAENTALKVVTVAVPKQEGRAKLVLAAQRDEPPKRPTATQAWLARTMALIGHPDGTIAYEAHAITDLACHVGECAINDGQGCYLSYVDPKGHFSEPWFHHDRALDNVGLMFQGMPAATDRLPPEAQVGVAEGIERFALGKAYDHLCHSTPEGLQIVGDTGADFYRDTYLNLYVARLVSPALIPQ